MKHGDKAKAKAKPAQAKASGKKSGAKTAAESKAKSSSKAAGKKEGSSAAKAVAEKSSPPKTGGNGKPAVPPRRPATAPDGSVNFTNPLVGNAFKRAVKKYPTAFRKLTD